MSDNQPDQLDQFTTVLNGMQDGAVANLSIKDTLDFVGPHERNAVLARFCTKVKYNTHIDIEGTDSLEVSRAYYYGYITLDELNLLMYHDGEQGNYRSSVSVLEDVCDKLTQLNFQIVFKRRNKYKYYIRALRLPPGE